jgi:MraZ protein
LNRSCNRYPILRGYATDCELDKHGRILLPQKLREFAGLEKSVVFLGQGNKFEVWDEGVWDTQRAEWLRGIDEQGDEGSGTLGGLSL